MFRNKNTMKTMYEDVHVIGVDHGFGNMKGSNTILPAGVLTYEKEPVFRDNLLVFDGKYYQVGIAKKEFIQEKVSDQDYYVMTLAVIAQELAQRGVQEGKVYLGCGLPLTWVTEQKEAFREYLLSRDEVNFTYKGKIYHVTIVGVEIFPQGFAAVAHRLGEFSGVNMLADVGNGTINVMYINNCRPVPQKCYTEKYGTHQCMLAVKEEVLRKCGSEIDDSLIEDIFRKGSADISDRYLTTIRNTATEYVEEIFRRLREHGYNPELMKLYVTGGGGCLIRNFGSYDSSRVVFVTDICANAKGYERLAYRKLNKNGGCV